METREENWGFCARFTTGGYVSENQLCKGPCFVFKSKDNFQFVSELQPPAVPQDGISDVHRWCSTGHPKYNGTDPRKRQLWGYCREDIPPPRALRATHSFTPSLSPTESPTNSPSSSPSVSPPTPTVISIQVNINSPSIELPLNFIQNICKRKRAFKNLLMVES